MVENKSKELPKPKKEEDSYDKWDETAPRRELNAKKPTFKDYDAILIADPEAKKLYLNWFYSEAEEKKALYEEWKKTGKLEKLMKLLEVDEEEKKEEKEEKKEEKEEKKEVKKDDKKEKQEENKDVKEDKKDAKKEKCSENQAEDEFELFTAKMKMAIRWKFEKDKERFRNWDATAELDNSLDEIDFWEYQQKETKEEKKEDVKKPPVDPPKVVSKIQEPPSKTVTFSPSTTPSKKPAPKKKKKGCCTIL